jgi:hypothetical protein
VRVRSNTLVPARAVPGDIMLLKTGHMIAADARSSGRSPIDESTPTEHAGDKISRDLRRRCAAARPAQHGFAATVWRGQDRARPGPPRDRDRRDGLWADTTTTRTPLERQLNHMGGQPVAASLGFCGLALASPLRGVPRSDAAAALSLAVAARPKASGGRHHDWRSGYRMMRRQRQCPRGGRARRDHRDLSRQGARSPKTA